MKRRVEFMDTDMAGIVHFTTFFRYMETAEHELLRAAGMPIEFLHEERNIGWPRVSCSFNFKKPLKFAEELEVRIQVTRLSKRSVTYDAELVRDNEVLATGQSTCACCEMQADGGFQPIEIPADIAEKLKPYVMEEKNESID
jgi:4-hydroxybenzoyl-CoA thioesterase/acyl-CoA thioester hydrolase